MECQPVIGRPSQLEVKLDRTNHDRFFIGLTHNSFLFPVLQLANFLSEVAYRSSLGFEIGNFGVNSIELTQNSSFEGVDSAVPDSRGILSLL